MLNNFIKSRARSPYVLPPVTDQLLEGTPPDSPRSQVLDSLSGTYGIRRSRSSNTYAEGSSDPLITMYVEKKSNGTLTRLEERLVHEFVEMRSCVAKALAARSQRFLQELDDTFEMSTSVQRLLRSMKVGSQTSDIEYHLVKCAQELRTTKDELREARQFIEEQNTMIKDLLTQNQELREYIEGILQNRQTKL